MLSNVEQFKERLLAKERELRDDITRFESEAREGAGNDVEDPIDAVTSSEAKTEAFKVSDLLHETLKEVQEALARISEGSYGRCIVCGREIEEARLEAVPWTRYCLADQEKQDRADQEERAEEDMTF
jgi:DnaK suppressor protein